ncbi:beta-ketoacyl-[acyl-carrier-protein] synthase family protein [Woodsholea maritima]|uniref:hypothetical protein n=1 Tax=Woodsholea maritima TaxID=240237 RepID=UPI000366ECBA|nr:hypothetical protein [Woodsholea maritima]
MSDHDPLNPDLEAQGLEDEDMVFDAHLTSLFAQTAPAEVDEAFVARVENRIKAPSRFRTLTLGGAGSLAGLIGGAQLERLFDIDWMALEQMTGLAMPSYGPQLLASICVGGVLMGVSLLLSQRA